MPEVYLRKRTLSEDCFMNMIQAVVTNGKIEIQAPNEFHDGETVSVIVLNHSSADAPLSPEEISTSLRALDQFTASFPILENGEDLSAPARLAGDVEKQEFSSYSDKLKGLFD